MKKQIKKISKIILFATIIFQCFRINTQIQNLKFDDLKKDPRNILIFKPDGLYISNPNKNRTNTQQYIEIVQQCNQKYIENQNKSFKDFQFIKVNAQNGEVSIISNYQLRNDKITLEMFVKKPFYSIINSEEFKDDNLAADSDNDVNNYYFVLFTKEN